MIFISYSKDDLAWRDQILAHLRENENIYHKKVTFYDADIESGEDFQKAIDFNVASVNVAVLLVSNSYLRSEYIKVHELEPLLRRKNVKIYWFLLSSCLWKNTRLSIVQCANTLNSERLIPLKELSESNRDEQVNKILSGKCREIYQYALHMPQASVKTPVEFIYKCNRNAESQLFKLVYLDRYAEKSLLAYAIVGDKEDSLNNLHNAIKLKVLVNDYSNYEIRDIHLSAIETRYRKEQNLLLFKSDLFPRLDIHFDPKDLKEWSVNRMYQYLWKQLTKFAPKQVYFISIKIESTVFQEDTMVEILKWFNGQIESANNRRSSLKLFLLFIFEKSNEPEQDANMMHFLNTYCQDTQVEKIINGEASLAGHAEHCLNLVYLGNHRMADKKALNEWYERDFKQWFLSRNIPLRDEADIEFEHVKEAIFTDGNEAKMRIVEKNLQPFLRY